MSKETPTWHMRRALRLAEKARGKTLPNPMVGAVLVKDGVRIGEGYHIAYGSAHAEVEAIQSATEDTRGATLYVNLEPCSHHGKTPPCIDAILEAGIRKVVIAEIDPSEKVNGRGVQFLKENGVDVEIGLLAEAARELNREFYTFHEKKRPWITLKSAISLDAKIAENPGRPTALSSKPAQKASHLMRAQHQAILVGAGTVLSDNPKLTTRLVEGRDPLRIILKGREELDPSAEVFKDENHLVYDAKNLDFVMQDLYEKGIVSVLVEGGSEVYKSFFEAKLIDEIQAFVCPHLLGENAVPFYPLTQANLLHSKSVRKLGQDTLLTFQPQWDSNNS